MSEITHVRLVQQGSSCTVRVSNADKWYVIDEAWEGKQLLDSHIVSSWDTEDEATAHQDDNRKSKSGTAPDTSIWLGNERRAWLKEHGGIQPTLHIMIDRAMKRNP